MINPKLAAYFSILGQIKIYILIETVPRAFRVIQLTIKVKTKKTP